MGNVPIKNPEGYVDMTMHDAMENIIAEEKAAATRAKRMVSRIKRMLDEEHFTLMNRIVIRDDETGCVYR